MHAEAPRRRCRRRPWRDRPRGGSVEAPTAHAATRGAAAGPLRFADLVLDPRTREVSRGERPVDLTPTEFTLLELFMRNPRQVLTHQVILDRVWCFDFGPRPNVLYVYIGYLRRKVEAGGKPRLIRTVRGVGYQLCDPTDGRPTRGSRPALSHNS